ncbi:MAG: DNA-protecting protein DprA [Phycisphaerae bacterium]
MPGAISDIARTHLRWMLTEGIGPILFSRVLAHFGDADRALAAAPGSMTQVKGIGQSVADSIARTRDSAETLAKVEAEIAAAEALGIRILCREDELYPAGLRHIPDPPIVLYIRGDLRPTDAVAIAVVGSRRCTIYGSEQARRFGELLAGAGFTVVSGLARGIDAFAQHGAVDAGGRSIAVMGCGLTEVYPPENAALAEKLLDCGAWISELPLKASVRAQNFPSRNRIIAGITLGTLVVEAAARSGALITAKLASEYNREVFAVPGRIQDPMSIGTNDMIRRGHAKLTTCLEDILDELGDIGTAMRGDDAVTSARGAAAERLARPGDDRVVNAPAPLSAPAATANGAAGDPSASGENGLRQPPRPTPVLTECERRVYEIVGVEPSLQDAVMARAQLPPGEVLAAFTGLELKRLIKRLPGQWVVRTGR